MNAKTDLNAEFNSLRPTEIIQVIERCMEVQRPCMIWGPPGIGKSDIIAQIGDRQKRPVIDLRLLLMEPTDLKGIPYYDPETREMRWAKPSDLPSIVNPQTLERARAALAQAQAILETDETMTETQIEVMARNVATLEGSLELANAILFLDEINAAPQSVQAAAYQLILNRRVGEYELPSGVSIIAAGNRETDKAVTFRMPSALANRFVHFEMKANYEDWENWAIESRVSADVIGFLTTHKQYLFDFNPRSSGKAFATPRSWTFVGQLLDDNLSEKLNQAMVAGTVGLGLAGEFMQHRRLKGKLPDPRDILEGRVTTLPKDKEVDVSAKYSLVIGMCYELEQMQNEYKEDKAKSDKDWAKVTDTFLTFMMGEGHFTKEMVIMGAVVALRKYKIAFESETPVFTKFYKAYQKWIVETV